MWIIRDVAIWFALHMLIVYICHKIPDRFYQDADRYFKLASFENEGKFYERYLIIKKWKTLLPDGGRINKYGFEKKIKKRDQKYLEKFHFETKRAELIHVLGLLSSSIFLTIHRLPFGLFIFAFAALFDIPFIAIQRYNRPRIEKLMKRKRRHSCN